MAVGISEAEYSFAIATIEESRRQIERGEGIPHDKVMAMVQELFLEK